MLELLRLRFMQFINKFTGSSDLSTLNQGLLFTRKIAFAIFAKLINFGKIQT